MDQTYQILFAQPRAAPSWWQLVIGTRWLFLQFVDVGCGCLRRSKLETIVLTPCKTVDFMEKLSPPLLQMNMAVAQVTCVYP